MKIMWIIYIIYIIILVVVCSRIIYDTRSSSKTLAYLLFAIFIPFVGMLFYFVFGVNYRKRVIYSKKLVEDEVRLQRLDKKTISQSARNLRKNALEIGIGESLVSLLMNES